MAQSLFHTPLFDLVVESKARMTAFAGWEMPVQFQGITQEHRAVRQQAGMFDISHMGRLLLKGPNLTAQLQTLVPSDLSTLQPGLAQYTVILNEAGGIIDDVICYYQGETADNQNWTLIVNGANREKDKNLAPEQLGQSHSIGGRNPHNGFTSDPGAGDHSAVAALGRYGSPRNPPIWPPPGHGFRAAGVFSPNRLHRGRRF